MHNVLGDENYERFCSLNPHEQIVEMLSNYVTFDLNDLERVEMVKRTVRFLHHMCKDLLFFISRR